VLLPPVLDNPGSSVVFGSSLGPDGVLSSAVNLYIAGYDGSALRRLTQYPAGSSPSGVTAVSLSADRSKAAYAAVVAKDGRNVEEVHLIDTTSGQDQVLATDTEGCVQALALCVNCFSTCVYTPHILADGSKVVYAAARNRPFYVVSADGRQRAQLSVYQGALAPSPQRVATRDSVLVFTSSAPSGPTFAPAATDVYLVNLDGSNLRQVTRFGNDASIYARNASISADGGVIVFESNFQTGKSQIWMVRGDGSGLRMLTSGDPSTSPALAADGARVAYLKGGQVWLVRTAEGSASTALTALNASQATEPSISGDGTRVSFVVGPGGGRGAIFSVGSDGANQWRVFTPKSIQAAGITSAAGSAPVAVGSLITIYGTNFAVEPAQSAERFPLPNSLRGVSVIINDQPVPLLAVTPWQVNAQVPPDVFVGNATLQVRFADTDASQIHNIEMKAAAPMVFSYPAAGNTPDAVYWQAAVFHAGGRIAADLAHPAAAGEVLEIYATGLGATNPMVPAGTAAPAKPPLAEARLKPQVLIGDKAAPVLFAGLVPGFAGLYQVNAMVPAGLPPGQYQVVLKSGDAAYAGPGTITVK
jgi:uncharacterized protein (TIGR03437 family)